MIPCCWELVYDVEVESPLVRVRRGVQPTVSLGYREGLC